MALTALEKKNKKLVDESIGDTVHTVYGECEVISYDPKTKEVTLEEDGDPFTVDLCDFHDL